MNRWKESIGWALVWSFSLLVGGLILYTGYFGALHYSSQESTPMMTNETEQAVSVSIAQGPEPEPEHEAGAGPGLGSKALNQNQTEDMFGDDQEIPTDKNLKNFPCPVRGNPLRTVGNYYSEAFDNYLFHAGTDYAEPEGTMIRATHGGKVIYSGADPILGKKVTLDCGDGWIVTYGSIVNLRVQVGETVETQDALGQVGLFNAAESESDQPQLHYEVWHGDVVQSSL